MVAWDVERLYQAPGMFPADSRSAGGMQALFGAERPIARAELNFTRAEGFWTDRKFNILPAAIEGNRIEAAVPPLTTACFLNLFDDRECVVSSEHVEL